MGEKMPEMTKLVPRDFRLVTKTGNELIKTITSTREASDHTGIIKEGLEAAIREYISIIVEKADLNELIDTKDDYKFLAELDVKSMLEKTVTGTTKDPVAEKSSHLIEQSIKNQSVIMKKMETIDRLDQVIKIADFLSKNKLFNSGGQKIGEKGYQRAGKGNQSLCQTGGRLCQQLQGKNYWVGP